MNIVLIGFAGSFKTSAGKKLAKKINYTFIDTDEAAEKLTNLSVKEMFDMHGEAFFRKAESAVVALVARQDKTVISTGGGVPLSDKNMSLLCQNAVTVWLTALPETLYMRLSASAERPLFNGLSLEKLEPIVALRDKKYYMYADRKVATDGLTSTEVACKIEEAVINLI